MNWVGIVRLLTQLVIWLVKNKLDDNQRKEIAREIDKASASWTDADVDKRLSNYYRDDDRP